MDADGTAAATAGAGRSAGGTAETSGDESDVDSVVVSEDDEPDDTATRLAAARQRARARAGRLSEAERQAILIASYGLARTLRRQRRRGAEPVSRFPLTTVPNPHTGVEEESAAKKAETFFADSPELLEEPPLPDDVPAPEPESKGKGDGDAPVPLPRSSAYWKEERTRQAAEPFVAGGVKEVELSFREGLRPLPPPRCHLKWGPVLRLDDMAPDQRRVVLRLLAKDVRSGALKFVNWEDVDLITPVFIAFHPVTMKPRLVHDLRPLNCRLTDSTVRLDRAADALCFGSFAAKLDLFQAFRHIRVKERDKRVMAFEVDGYPVRWEVLPFGCSQSPELFADALASAIGPTSGPGWKFVVYVDDILVVATSRDALDDALMRLMTRLRGGGWTIALDKTYPYEMSVAPFLGLLVDLDTDRLRVSVAKATRLRDLCQHILGGTVVSLRDLQRVGGLLAFFTQAVPEAALGRCGINAATAEAESLPGRTVGVAGGLRADLQFWLRHALALPNMTRPGPTEEARGLAVATDAAGLPSLAFGGVVWTDDAPSTPDIDAAIREVNARGKHVREQGCSAFGGWAVSRPFPVSAASSSSGALEVAGFRGVLAAYVQARGPEALRGRVIRWYCDARVAVGAVGRWRARAPGLVHELTELLLFTRKYSLTVIPHWVARSAGWQPVVDALSKIRWQPDTAEWALPRAAVEQILGWASFRPEVDLFASEGMTVLPRYVSRFPEAGSAWTDAFARRWTGMKAYAFPPFSAAAAMLRHCCGSPGLQLVAVVPRVTAVPARTRTVWRRQLEPPPRLVDVTGHQAPRACPVKLDAIEIAVGDG